MFNFFFTIMKDLKKRAFSAVLLLVAVAGLVYEVVHLGESDLTVNGQVFGLVIFSAGAVGCAYGAFAPKAWK